MRKMKCRIAVWCLIFTMIVCTMVVSNSGNLNPSFALEKASSELPEYLNFLQDDSREIKWGEISSFAVSADGNQMAISYNDDGIHCIEIIGEDSVKKFFMETTGLVVPYYDNDNLILKLTRCSNSIWQIQYNQMIDVDDDIYYDIIDIKNTYVINDDLSYSLKHTLLGDMIIKYDNGKKQIMFYRFGDNHALILYFIIVLVACIISAILHFRKKKISKSHSTL